MTDLELKALLQKVTKELTHRSKNPKAQLDPQPVDLCHDLHDAANATHQALIDNHCEPL